MILHHHMDIITLIQAIGYMGVLLIIFAETGLFFGFFLPGDSLVFTAGLLASQHIFNAWILIPAMFCCAIIGYGVAYWFGSHLRTWLLTREDSFWFKKKYLQQAEIFYTQYGGFALILGRLMPIVRTFVPIVAGMVNMNYKRFSMLNIAGGFIWIGGLSLSGYYLGEAIPHSSRYLLPIVILIVFLSVLPGIWQFLKKRIKSRGI